ARAAGIGAGAGQGESAAADLLDRAQAAYRAGEGHAVGPIEQEAAIIVDVAEDAAAGSTRADLQRSAPDRGAAGIEIGAGQDQGSGIRFGEAGISDDGGVDFSGDAGIDAHQSAEAGLM